MQAVNMALTLSFIITKRKDEVKQISLNAEFLKEKLTYIPIKVLGK